MFFPPKQWLMPDSFAEATEVQREIARKIVVEDDFGAVAQIAGVDVSCNFRDPKQMLYGAVVALDVSTLNIQETVQEAQKQTFPYVSGYLAFREAPVIVAALQKLKAKPDLLFCDGQGICHPRGVGIASHLGVLCDIPTIGVGKSILVGEPAGTLGPNFGDMVPLIWQKREVGMLVRTRSRANPLVISIGNRIHSRHDMLVPIYRIEDGKNLTN